jgi:hypothetical protein
LTLGFFLMTEGSFSFPHFPNLHSYIEIICLYLIILKNVQATIFIRIMHILKFLSVNATCPFYSQFMKNYVLFLQNLIIPSYSSLNHISNDYSCGTIRYLS